MNEIDISVIIPCYNEENVIYNMLSRLTDELSKTSYVYEIIFCDNGSTDNSRTIAGKFPVYIVKSRSKTIAGVRNDGVAVAKGKLLIFLDADIIVDREWGVVVEALFDLIVGSGVIIGSPPTFSDAVSSILRPWYKAISNDARSTHLGTGHMMLSADNFKRIGKFDVSLISGEDYDFCVRAKRLGVLIVTEPRLVVCHVGYPINVLNFAKREMWHGEGDFKNFSSMLKSKVALTAMFFNLVLMLTFIMLFVNLLVSLVLFVLALCVVIATQYYKFGFVSLWSFFCRSYICCIYLFSRSASLPLIAAKKIKVFFS